MNVAFDAERLRNRNSGLGQFCRALGLELLQQRPDDAELTFIVPRGQPDAFGTAAHHVEARWWHRYQPPASGDVWHATHQDSWIRPPRNVPLVLTIHDLNFLERSDYSRAKKARRLAAVQAQVDRAAIVSAVSEYSAGVIRQNLRIGNTPIRVIHPGNPLDVAGAVGTLASDEGVLARLAGRRFFLFVGVIHPKKNVHTLLPLLHAFPAHTLVLAGMDSHSYARDVAARADALGVGGRVLMPGAVSDSVKQALYERCEALLFPSLSEGFGLPAVEAMSLGKPVFLSRLTSLPEVGGDAARYFDAFDPEAMVATVARGLEEFESDPTRRSALVAQAARFSWRRAARAHWEMYADAR